MKIIFLDIETNGLDPSIHAPLEVAIVIKNDEGVEIDSYHAYVKVYMDDWILADSKALEINGFCKDNHDPYSKSRDLVAFEIRSMLKRNEINNSNSFFLCQNPSFDRPFFNILIPEGYMKAYDFPYHWLDLASMYWIKMLVPREVDGRIINYHPDIRIPPMSKDSIAHSLGIPPEEKPHRAMNGVIHLIECYEKLLMKKDFYSLHQNM